MAMDSAAVTMRGIAKILGVSRSTLYERIAAGTYSLAEIPMMVALLNLKKLEF